MSTNGTTAAPDVKPAHAPELPTRAPVWRRPRALGYHEALRGFGGVVSPFLAGFSLAAIATLTTASEQPRLSEWVIAALAATVALLLFSMQVAFAGLHQNSSPGDVLMWRPEATVSATELQLAREAQAADFAEMTRLAGISFNAYSAGLLTFLLAVGLLLVPDEWSVAAVIGLAVIAAALLLEIWWIVANHGHVPHPVLRVPSVTHRTAWQGELGRLDATGLSAVLDRDRRDTAGLPPLD